MKHTLILFLVFGALSLSSTSCRKNKASWDADYLVPLVDDSLSLKNWVNDSTISVNSAGYYHLNLKREVFKFDLNSEIQIPDTTIHSAFSTPVSINVPPGFQFVNDAQEKKFSLSNLELNTVYFSKGEIEVDVYNPYGTNIICHISLPKTKRNGIVIVDSMVVGPGTLANPTKGTKTIDISQAVMDMTGLANNSFNKLTYQITINTDPNGVSVSSTPIYVTEVDTKLQNLGIDYAKGYFGQRTIAGTAETSIEDLKKWVGGTLDLQNANVDIVMSNSIKAMGRIKIIEFKTTKQDGTVTSLISNQINVPQNVNPATGSWSTLSPSLTHFIFNNSNSNIETFLENAGPDIKVVYEFEINPLGNITGASNEIFPQSIAKLDVFWDMPLSIGLGDFTLRDTIETDFSKNTDQLSRAKSAKITIDTENSFPISCDFMLVVLDENGSVILTKVNDKEIQSGLYGSPNSFGSLTSKEKFIWDLNSSEIDKLKNGKKIMIQGVFNTPDPSTGLSTSVLISEKSFVATKVLLHLTYENKI